MDSLIKKQAVFDKFAGGLSSTRKEKIKRAAANRTHHIVVVLEDVYQSLNISAVLRSCDCFGIQTIYIIEKRNRYKIQESVAKGAAGWLDIKRYKDTETCFFDLKAAGYTILGTTPHEKTQFLDTVSIDKPIAIVFGTEETGISDYALKHADGFVAIPMYGFTESFNISVSAALCLYELTTKLRASLVPWRLSSEQIIDLQLEWLGRSTHMKPAIEKQLQASE